MPQTNREYLDAGQTNFMVLASQVSRQWRRVLDRQLRPSAITEPMWQVLVCISRARTPLRQKDLADALYLDASSIVRVLDALEKTGLILRGEMADDRRAKTLQLTALGMSTVTRIEKQVGLTRDFLLAQITFNDLDVAKDVLEKLIASLKKVEKNLG